MAIKVFILSTVRKPELLPMTMLVFRTIRTGFPTADVFVHGNGLSKEFEAVVVNATENRNCKYFAHEPTIHHVWLEQLCETQQEPFVICDTDMVFHESVEEWKFETSLAGWRIPEWRDEFTGCITRARLHTSLLFIEPVKLRADIAKFYENVLESEFTPRANLFYPLVLPFKKARYFYDTAGLLYHAVGGTQFTEQQIDAYTHLNFGCISDLVLPRLEKRTADGFRLARSAILQNPARGRGTWRGQLEYFRQRQ